MPEHQPAPRKAARLAASGVALLASAVLLAGCGDAGGDGPSRVSGTAGPAGEGASGKHVSDDTGADGPDGGASRAPTPDSSASGSKKPPADQAEGGGSDGGTTERCHTPDLKASVVSDGTAMGQWTFSLVLTNTSDRACTVKGYPGLAFLGDDGRQVSSVEPERTGPDGSAVRLAPGDRARSGMKYSNPELTGAKTVDCTKIAVTPPDEKNSLTAAWPGGEVAADSSSGSVPQVLAFAPAEG